MEKASNFVRVSENLKIDYASYFLKNEANYWWESTRALEGKGPFSWARFTELFLEKYFPDCVRNQMEIEFLELKQGGRSVAEYEAKFTELARFVPDYVCSKAQKARRFQQGLKPEIRSGVVALQLMTYPSVVQAALVIEFDQKLAAREKEDKKRKSDDMEEALGQEGSSQKSHKKVGRRVVCYNCGKVGHVAKIVELLPKIALEVVHQKVQERIEERLFPSKSSKQVQGCYKID
ncbi:hypothetical protein AgCh_022434 [Apium graveolens]